MMPSANDPVRAGSLVGKHILVTGASSGIGRGIAKGFAREGANIFVTGFGDPEALESLVCELRANGTMVYQTACDLEELDQIDRLFAEVEQSFPRLDAIVNNAGTSERRPALEVDRAHFNRIFQTNVRGTFFCMKNAAQLMTKSGGGKILNISSFQALSPSPDSSVYSASKAAVNGLTRALAVELAPRNIQVNTLSPGWIVVEKDPPLTDEEHSDYTRYIPAGRLGSVQDIVEMAVFLISDRSQFTTGANIVVDGGQSVPLHFPPRDPSSPIG